jgi:hypothetical protein
MAAKAAPCCRTPKVVCALAIAAACAVACHKKKADPDPAITIEHEITPMPARVGTVRITLTLKDQSGHAITNAQLSVEGDMSHPGMGPVLADAKETEPGRYQADLKFSMGGDWVILVHSKLPDGRKVERQFEVRDVRSD